MHAGAPGEDEQQRGCGARGLHRERINSTMIGIIRRDGRKEAAMTPERQIRMAVVQAGSALASGVHHSYSSYGFALLGELLARRAGSDFESALRTRILEPLGMVRSGFALTPELRPAQATGDTSRGDPRRPAAVPRGMLGSGALRSTANDLVRFLQAHLGLRESTLATALRATQRTEADRQRPDLPMGLGWFYTDLAGRRLVYHGGSTPGFRAYVGMDLERRRGVVVLGNSDHDVTNLALHLLDSYVPLYSP